MMTLRAGRRALHLGFAALCGIGGAALPAAAQSYLADNGGGVTVDYSVLGQGAGPVTRTPLPNGLPGGAMPAGGCSCANAPMGVIAAAPRPTFTNPFGNAPVAQAPAVPPGFMAYSQAVGSSSNTGAVVLKAPGGSATQMAASAPAPIEEPALPPSTPTANDSGTAATAPSSEPSLPVTTPTQSASSEAAAPIGGATPPAAPETMPTDVPSPVEQPATQAPAETAPAEPAPTAPAPEAQAPAEQTPAEQTPAEPAPAASSGETQTAEAPPAETPPAASAETGTEPPEQQAAVTPPAPSEGTTPPAEGGAALPAGAYRILYTGESDDVPATANGELDKIAQDLLANQDKRVQVMSYAAGTADTESKARRKSLARGLAIRSYLIKAGVPSTRIDVRALGNKAEGGPADRVDIVPAS